METFQFLSFCCCFFVCTYSVSYGTGIVVCGTHVHIMANHAGFVLTLDDDDPVPDEEADTDEEARCCSCCIRHRRPYREILGASFDRQHETKKTDARSESFQCRLSVLYWRDRFHFRYVGNRGRCTGSGEGKGRAVWRTLEPQSEKTCPVS